MGTHDIRKGIYRHFKGGFYEVLGTARHSETEELMVIYRPVTGDGGLWVRPMTMFTEAVAGGGSRFAWWAEPRTQED